jgi:hypothetical protein
MFYRDGLGNELRFGDVVKGFVLTNAVLIKTHWDTTNPPYDINVLTPDFSVIMTPCCSIEDKTIAVTQLIPVRISFFDNPHWADDLTRINRIMSPQESVSPQVWSQLSTDEQQRRIAEGNTYAHANLFIYDKHEILPEYPLSRKRGNETQKITTGYYMVDFKNIVKVNCDRILSPSDSPLECRLLELTVEAREELRIKLGWYYSRRPEEDQVLLDMA